MLASFGIVWTLLKNSHAIFKQGATVTTWCNRPKGTETSCPGSLVIIARLTSSQSLPNRNALKSSTSLLACVGAWLMLSLYNSLYEARQRAVAGLEVARMSRQRISFLCWPAWLGFVFYIWNSDSQLLCDQIFTSICYFIKIWALCKCTSFAYNLLVRKHLL